MKHILLFAALLASASAIAQIPTIGLAGKYSFTGNANDESGNNLNGTVMGATLTEDRFGVPNSAYSFNGIDNYILLPNTNLINNNSYTYSFWAKPYALITNYSGVMYSLGSTTENKDQMVTFDNLERFAAGSYNIGTALPFQSKAATGTIVPGTWRHIAVTRDLSSIRMYLDGVLLASDPDNATNNQPADYGTDSRVVIGGRSHLGSDSYFNGAIDDLRHYNRVLSQNEVLALFNEANVASTANQEITNNFTVSINPNPGNGNLRLKVNNAAYTEINTQIINSLGQVVYYDRDDVQMSDYIKELSLTNIASGIYFVKVSTGSETTTNKLIIQK